MRANRSIGDAGKGRRQPTSKGAKHDGRGVAGYPRCDGSGRVGRFFSPARSEARKILLPRDLASDLCCTLIVTDAT